jgi:polysaccharide biosynthesis protein PslG
MSFCSLMIFLIGAPAPRPFDTDAPFEAGLGVNIHFTRAPAEEMDLLAAAGFHWVRMDFAWGAVEREDGKYRFEDYDFLVAEMEKRKIRCLFILDYGHPRLTRGLPPADDAGRAAYARFAAAAAAHYRGRQVVWEIWNEPNIAQFWKPKPDVAAYIAMAREAVAAIKKAAPDAIVIAPATSTFDFPFL